MRELVTSTFVSLDGVMQAPGGPEEDPEGGFDQGGWSVNFWDDSVSEFMDELMGKPYDLVLGRRTYEIFASHWPHTDEPGAEGINRATKYVASRTLESLEWGPSQLLKGDVGAEVARIKEEDGPELQVHGSADLIQTLIPAGVIDRYRVITFPVVLGKGKRLFGESTPPAALRLIDSKLSSTGVVMSIYEPAGEITLGTFGLE